MTETGAQYREDLWIKEISRAEIKIRQTQKWNDTENKWWNCESSVADHPFLWMVKVITSVFWQMKWKTWPRWRCTPVKLPTPSILLNHRKYVKNKLFISNPFSCNGKNVPLHLLHFLPQTFVVFPTGLKFNLFSNISFPHPVQLGS